MLVIEILALGLLLGPAPPVAAQEGKLTVGVMPVEGAARLSEESKEDLRVELERQLVSSAKVTVIERGKLDELVDELELSHSGLIDPAHMRELGRLVGVDALLFPRIVNAGAWERRERIPIVNRDEVTVSASFSVALELVRTETGRILVSEKSSGAFKTTLTEAEAPIPSKGAALASARARAVSKAGGVVLTALFPVKVAHVDKDKGIVALNRGKDSLKVGQRLTVYSQGETIRDPDTGEVLGSEEEAIGKIRVTEVRGKMSLARLLKGEAVAGAVCR
ncbi:MAG: Curli production assembly/transport component CsgG [Candidatus Kentron sp. G]|nr:MAG: Curli production assembly/transport component CsgG [Candidatus Kentron sp. G]VFM97202.1 MAG: Curli production assembly/transport component CsgG [Candidatus Kentron sp. G]VFM99610.1 MAG: Curli production assembly/transport component CsgG [Candidatus Kentron sp. G]